MLNKALFIEPYTVNGSLHGSHPLGYGGSFEGRSGSGGTARDGFAIEKDYLSICSDIDIQNRLRAIQDMGRAHSHGDITADIGGDPSWKDKIYIRKINKADVRCLQGQGSDYCWGEWGDCDPTRILSGKEVDHRGVSHCYDLFDRFCLYSIGIL